jgi:tetratricopeptide (TPR) repeat protein
MALLRLTQSTTGVDRYRIEVSLERSGYARQAATSEFSFALTPQEREDMRWYLEDYLQYPIDPAPQIAARIVTRLDEIGRELFRSIFHSSDDARDLWATVRADIDRYRVEVVTGVQEAASIPWELIRDPKTDASLALRAEAFVRSHPAPAQQARLMEPGGGAIRVLLVICRPGGSDDVPFRSVASRLVKGLKAEARQSCELRVLRPPTFDQLSKTLLRAKLDKKPYHIVHFDGHGVFADAKQNGGGGAEKNKAVLARAREGKHGFLVFESAVAGNQELVDGSRLGGLLAEGHVPLLVLNACRSAHADPPAQPEAAGGEATVAAGGGLSNGSGGAHEQVRVFGSLAQEVMDAGVSGVVAMRYNVYVITAAQFVTELYSSLVQGDSVGVAATAARKNLAAQPLREIAFAPCALEDWSVPVVYEAAPITLFPKMESQGLTISLDAGKFESAAPGNDALPPRPDIGFFGRDETLLALDRAFDTQSIVVLHSYAGSGKTSTAVEFVRWYRETGGIGNYVLFTSFEQHLPLARVLDQLGERFSPALKANNIHWLALSEKERVEVALSILQQIPVLWIWDNVELVAGFPTGTPSAWTEMEQSELAFFLRAAGQTQAKFLLTSRRNEHLWLGDLPRRITVPAMPMQERVQLAKGVADRQGRKLDEVEDWRPLLEFSRGNPFTITVLVGEALRNGLKTKKEIEVFVQELREGTADVDDDETQGRDRSLGASVSYGFKHAFTEAERRTFALLHLFQGIVTPGSLVVLCDSGRKYSEELVPVSREEATGMLNRAAEVGLLTAVVPDHQYTIHPAIPWYFKKLFESYYTDRVGVTHAFVSTVAGFGGYIAKRYDDGERDLLFQLVADEQNLLHALRLARTHAWWEEVIGVLRVINKLYAETGRKMEYLRVLEDVVPDFLDPVTSDPVAGMDEWWFEFASLRARDIRMGKDGARKAEHIYARLILYARMEVAKYPAPVTGKPEDNSRVALSNLGTVLQNYGIMQWLDADAKCVSSLQEALDISEQLEERDGIESAAMHLGHAYVDFQDIRDLVKAEQYYQRKLDMATARQDPFSAAHALREIGQIYYFRFIEARQEPEALLEKLGEQGFLDHLNMLINAALTYARKAAELVPPGNPFASHIHHLIGNIYDDAGQPDVAIQNYEKSIQVADACGDTGGASKGRREVARAYLKTGRLENALAYAEAAVKNLENGAGLDVAAGDMAAAQGLLATIRAEITSRQRGGQRVQ